MVKIEPATLHKINEDVKALLLDNFGIKSKKLGIKIYVNEEQYNQLKENFPDSNHRELIVTENGDDWVVELLRWPFMENEVEQDK